METGMLPPSSPLLLSPSLSLSSSPPPQLLSSLPPRIARAVADHKMEKIAKKLKDLTEKKERSRASMRHYMTFWSATCTIYVAVIGFEVVYGNNPKRAACSPLKVTLISVVGAILLLVIVMPLMRSYINKYKKCFIVKLTKRNLKKKRELIKSGKRENQIPNDNPRFYMAGQLSREEITERTKKVVTRVRIILALAILNFGAFVFLLAEVFLLPCRTPSPSPSPSPSN